MDMANHVHRGSLPGGSDGCVCSHTSSIRQGNGNSCYFAAELRGRSWIDAGFRLCFSPGTI